MFHLTSDIYWKNLQVFFICVGSILFLLDCEAFQSEIWNFDGVWAGVEPGQWLSINQNDQVEEADTCRAPVQAGGKFYSNYRSHLPLWEIEMWKLAPVETENTNLNEHILCQETLNRIQMASPASAPPTKTEKEIQSIYHKNLPAATSGDWLLCAFTF